MFWSGNFIVVRELNFLLKEENVTLSQVLEADDILQECKADNKALMQFLTRPDILAELVTLVTAEPPAGVELAAQYRHASIACEVLTSPLSSLSDRLSLDTHQMNRLCDFINRDPPLNPLLASYFSKTIEMLLERNPKQDWYLYHIVCLRVLDFFKSRRDFLPNLLRHISTSAIADTFKYFIRLDDLFNKIVMEWLEEHQFIECLIQIICGTYMPESAGARAPDEPEKGTREPSEKHNHAADALHAGQGSPDHQNNVPAAPAEEPEARAARRRRIAAVASANACALLCDLVATGCAAEGAAARSRTATALAARLAGGAGVRALLQAVFTSAGRARAAALVHGARLLRHLLDHHPVLGAEGGPSSTRSQVELAAAPHLPLLHQALLRDPATYAQEEDGSAETGAVERGPGAGAGAGAGAVGAARIQVAALLAHLASSEVEEVPTTMLTLGTPGVLVDMFFQYPDNNFLHAQLLAFCRNAFANPAYRTQYATHLLLECDLLTRLMDAYEENENKQAGAARAGHAGHVTLALGAARAAAEALALPPALAARWRAFALDTLDPALNQFATPLGGTYPSENSYDLDNSIISDRLNAYYDASAGGAGAADSAEFIADGLELDDDDKQMSSTESRFMELANQRFDEDMWDEAPEGEGEAAPAALREVLGDGSPWDSEPAERGAEPAPGGEGWAQFESLAPALAPADPFAHYWPYESAGADSSSSLDAGLLAGRAEGCVSLATNLLTAMSGMSPADVANIVNANLDLASLPPADLASTDDKVGEVAVGQVTSDRVTGDEVTSEQVAVEKVTEEQVTNEQVTDAKVTDTSIEVTGAIVKDANAPVVAEAKNMEAFSQVTAEVMIAPAKVTEACEKVTDAAVTEASVKATDVSPNVTDTLTNIQSQDVPSSNVASNSIDSNALPNKESIESTVESLQETKDLNEITDKMNDISLSDKSEDSATVLDTKVLDTSEVAEASEAAER